MQFTYPVMLWGLFLLIIPIIIHLFQLRKFRKEAFTNVALLQKIEVQTRKSSQLKKWLIFIIRMLAATAIIIAFSQPYYAKKDISETKNDLVIYLDNSFSMQVRGTNGVLFRKAVQDIIENVPEDITFTLLTNDKTFKNTSIKAIKDQLLALEYSPRKFALNDAILKGKTAFTTKNSSDNILILLSDFQQNESNINIKKDSLATLRLVKLTPQSTANIAIDSLYISEKNPDGLTLGVQLSRQENNGTSTPVSLFNGEKLLAKASATFQEGRDKTNVSFDITSEAITDGKITVEEDSGLLFDNTLYFSIDQKEKINVLAINEADASFLERIYTEEEFVLTSVASNALNYNSISSQDVIVLNELKNIPNALITTLQSFKSKGGSIVVIPSEEESYTSYNQLLSSFNLGTLSAKVSQEKKIITIAYSHPVFRNVFEKQVQNFQYPGAKSYYTHNGNASAVLRFENNAPFLLEKNNVYLFTAPLNDANSSFKNSPLIVPVFYNIGKNSMKLPQPYYTIGHQNTFDIKTTLQKDAILTLSAAATSFIPQQQAFDTKVQLSTYEAPSEAGTYTIQSVENTIAHVSFNYNRDESRLRYHAIDTLENITAYASVPQLFNTIKNENNTTALWKWFVIFALAFLITEFLLLNFFK